MLVYPAAATGVAVSSTATAWASSAAVTLVPASTLGDIEILGLLVQGEGSYGPDSTYATDFQLDVGGVTDRVILPHVLRYDTAVGNIPGSHAQPATLWLPEPKTVASGALIQLRARGTTLAAAGIPYRVKLIYQLPPAVFDIIEGGGQTMALAQGGGTLTPSGLSPISGGGQALASAQGGGEILQGPANVVSGIVGWWDMSLLSGADGSAVASVPDQSGHGRTIVKGGTLGPTLETAQINGLNTIKGRTTTVLSYDHGANTLITGTTVEIIAVVHFQTPGDSQGRIVSFAAGGNDYDNAGSAAALYYDNTALGFTSYRNAFVGGVYTPSGSPEILGSRWTGTQSIIRGAGTDTTPTSDTQTFGVRAIGIGNAPGLGAATASYIGEVVIYDRALSSGERTAIETYLTNKWISAVTPTIDGGGQVLTSAQGGANLLPGAVTVQGGGQSMALTQGAGNVTPAPAFILGGGQTIPWTQGGGLLVPQPVAILGGGQAQPLVQGGGNVLPGFITVQGAGQALSLAQGGGVLAATGPAMPINGGGQSMSMAQGGGLLTQFVAGLPTTWLPLTRMGR